MIRAVAFDIGGVLERVGEPDFVESWRVRLEMSPDRFTEVMAGIDPQDQIGTGEISEVEYRRLYESRLGLSGGQVEEFFADMWDWYCGTLDETLLAYAASLRPAYKTCIISNSSDGARREEQARYGFDQLVDEIIYSHEVGFAKPDPRIYELACKRLGVAYDELVFVDDTPGIVDAARELGIYAIHHLDTTVTIAAIEARLTG